MKRGVPFAPQPDSHDRFCDLRELLEGSGHLGLHVETARGGRGGNDQWCMEEVRRTHRAPCDFAYDVDRTVIAVWTGHGAGKLDDRYRGQASQMLGHDVH